MTYLFCSVERPGWAKYWKLTKHKSVLSSLWPRMCVLTTVTSETSTKNPLSSAVHNTLSRPCLLLSSFHCLSIPGFLFSSELANFSELTIKYNYGPSITSLIPSPEYGTLAKVSKLWSWGLRFSFALSPAGNQRDRHLLLLPHFISLSPITCVAKGRLVSGVQKKPELEWPNTFPWVTNFPLRALTTRMHDIDGNAHCVGLGTVSALTAWSPGTRTTEYYSDNRDTANEALAQMS